MSEIKDLIVLNKQEDIGITVSDIQDLGRELGRKTPKSHVYTRPGPAGMKLSYIPWALVARRMNELFGPSWSFEYLGVPKMEGNEVIVGVRVITPLGRQDAYGGAKYLEKNPNASYSDAVGSAGSKALRRACARLGIGLDLYITDEEVRDEDPLIVESKAVLKAIISRKKLTNDAALNIWGEVYDKQFNNFGEVVQFVIQDINCSEIDAIWSMIDDL